MSRVTPLVAGRRLIKNFSSTNILIICQTPGVMEKSADFSPHLTKIITGVQVLNYKTGETTSPKIYRNPLIFL